MYNFTTAFSQSAEQFRHKLLTQKRFGAILAPLNGLQVTPMELIDLFSKLSSSITKDKEY